ncbi:MAG: hypothetical protein ABIA04_05835 [Pseudomonadota bacterium]
MNEKFKRFDFSKIKTYPIASRKNLVSKDKFSKLPDEFDSFKEFYKSLPDILVGKDFKKLVTKIKEAKDKKKPFIAALGGHVIKSGVAPFIIKLIKEGFLTGISMNGSTIIHDFEIAMIGETSEDVAKALHEGKFGCAEETGANIFKALKLCENHGYGGSIGKYINDSSFKYKEYSVAYNCFKENIPLTVHSASGTEIIYQHPDVDGALLGKASQVDFEILCENVKNLTGGGVFLNIGSAVIMPEVFLKAIAVVTASGFELENITTANFDMIQHYRPLTNVVKRPTLKNSEGFAITGHHEILIPLLAFSLLNS